MKKIVQLGYPTLTQRASEVTDFKSQDFQNLVDELIETVKKSGERGAGLAANQVGELQRVSVLLRMDLQNKAKQEGKPVEAIWEVVVNPEYKSKSLKKTIYWEGCLSVKEGKIFGEVERPAIVEIDYQDRHGEKKSLKASGYFSHLVQHEIDHLDGILFLNYISDPSELYTDEELDEMNK